MEKLKVLSAYLPFGLKGKLISDKTDDFAEQEWVNDISIFKKEAVWDLCGYADEKGELMIPLGEGYFEGWLWRNKTTYANFHSGIKPILFSLEDLTKTITIGGKEIIAINYIATSIQNRQRILRRVSNNLNLDVLEYWQFERLIELKFNVFNLPEDAYVKVTEDFNPYK